MNADEISMKLWKIQRYFKESLDQAVGDLVLSREEVVKNVNELLGFGHLEPWCGDTVEPIGTENMMQTIKLKLAMVGLKPVRIDEVHLDRPTSADTGEPISTGIEFMRVGVYKSDKELDLWLKMELPNGFHFCKYYLTTESPFNK